jgi:hypothetical protein
LDPSSITIALQLDGRFDRDVIDRRLSLISDRLPADDPFWDRAVAAWRSRFQFERLRATLRPMFDVPPPARDWQALVRIFLALAPDCTAQLMRAWPDQDGPAELVRAMSVFDDAALPAGVRGAFDASFIGAHRAAKRARGADGVAHPMPHAVPMAAVLATPPRELLLRAEASAAAAGARVSAAESALAQQREDIEVVRRSVAAAEPSIAAARRDITAVDARVTRETEQVRDEVAVLRGGVRDEIAALRRLIAAADPAASAPLAAALEDAERRLRASESRSSAADARVTAAEVTLARQQEDIDALRRAASSAEPAAAAALRRELAAVETRVHREADGIREELADLRGGLRDEVAGLRRAMATAEPSAAPSIAAALDNAERRLHAAEARSIAADARVAAAEHALAYQRAEIEAIREAAASAAPQASDAVRRDLADIEARLVRSTADVRDQIDVLRRAVKSVDPAAVAPIAASLAGAEQRLRVAEYGLSTADQRFAATEQALNRQRAEIDALRRAADPTVNDALRRELAAVEARSARETEALRHELAMLRGGLRTEFSGMQRDPRPTAPGQPYPSGPADGGGGACPLSGEDGELYADAYVDAAASEVAMDRIEFYIRGPKAVQFWSSHNIGMDPYLNELFRLYWAKHIVKRLSPADAAQADASLDALLKACRDYGMGKMPADTAAAVSHTVTFLTTKAGFGAYKATVVKDLYEQDLLDPDLRRKIHVATAVTNRANNASTRAFAKQQEARPRPNESPPRARSNSAKRRDEPGTINRRQQQQQQQPRQQQGHGRNGGPAGRDGGRGRGQGTGT